MNHDEFYKLTRPVEGYLTEKGVSAIDAAKMAGDIVHALEKPLVEIIEVASERIAKEKVRVLLKPTKLSDTTRTMQLEIESGQFTTAYNFAKRHGITHQAAYQSKARLKKYNEESGILRKEE